jgi:ribonuclease P protein component
MPERPPPKRLTFPKTHRLRTQRDFDAIYKGGAAKTIGPLRVIGLPNALGHRRLGLSVSKRIGKAVARNRLKRMLREAFRISQHDLPGAYDLVVIARPHEPLGLEDYRRMLLDGMGKVHRHWTKVQPES